MTINLFDTAEKPCYPEKGKLRGKQSVKKEGKPMGDAENQTSFNESEMLLMGILGNDNNVVMADAVMICNSSGTVLSVHDTYEHFFGVSKAYVVGKSVYELEQEGIFTPSVTRMVIEKQQRIVTTQRNKTGTLILTTGIPIFDDQNTLRYVVCLNAMDVLQLENIKKKYNELKFVLDQKNEEVAALRQRYLQPTNMQFRSPNMVSMWECAMQFAATKANILITGETGVGKSLIAKEIHFASRCASGPFVEINCATLHESLIESELFGYERGAFTGANITGKLGKIELADKGTLFLDEIGELPLSAQAKLLDVIQSKTLERVSGNKKIPVDFRLITATNRNLMEAVEKGTFRKDLYYRLNVAHLQIPPLRERKADIVILADLFLKRFNTEYEKHATYSPQFIDFLEQYSWPGNVRELENLIERMVITTTTNTIDVEYLPIDVVKQMDIIPYHTRKASLPEMMDEYEKRIILNSIRRYRTTVAVARDLGISQGTVSRKISKYFGDDPAVLQSITDD